VKLLQGLRYARKVTQKLQEATYRGIEFHAVGERHSHCYNPETGLRLNPGKPVPNQHLRLYVDNKLVVSSRGYASELITRMATSA